MLDKSDLGRYRPPHEENWQVAGHDDPKQRFYQAIDLVDLTSSMEELPAGSVAIIGFVCDEGIKRNHGRVGAAEGPAAIRRALAKLPIPRSNRSIVDIGDVICIDNNLEEAQRVLADLVGLALSQGAFPIVLGGGHEQAWGNYQGIKKANRHEDLTIVNIDAHYDMRPLIDGKYGSSGTSFLQIARERESEGLPFQYTIVGIQETGNSSSLVDKARELNVRTISAKSMYAEGPQATMAKLETIIGDASHIHLSICMDVFAAAFAPGVSAPQPLGLAPWMVIPLLEIIKASNKMISIEIAEVSPPLDQDGITSKLAASLIYYLT